VVGTFNGAFKTTHGEYGMMVGRRVLVPPTPGAATVVTTHDGEVGFGNWPDNKQLPGNVVSFRQNLDPLVEDGVANPTGRYIWGWQLAGQGVLTERTAICLSRAGHVYYAWGREISGPRLAKALRQAGCDYAMHLDMNPKHCGFVFTNIVDVERKAMTLKLAHPEMTINPSRYVFWSQKDFFYVTLRDPEPPATGGIEWTPVKSAQPPPTWLPAQFRGTVRVGGLDVEVHAFEKGRVDWAVRSGRAEPDQAGKRPKKYDLTDAEAQGLIGAIGLGHTTSATGYGLAFEAKASIELRNPYATLVLASGQVPEIRPPGKGGKLASDQDAVQLPLIAEAGEVLPAGRVHGAMRTRGALCVTPFDRVLFAMVHHDSDDPNAVALLKAGCQRVVSTDRGSKHPAFVHLSGSETPPLRGYEATVLYALGRQMKPHAFRWKPAGSKRAVKPTGFDRQPAPE
jgi:hypothetical protein